MTNSDLAGSTLSHPPEGNTREVFSAFLRLGLTSFGGPIAHLAYFRAEFVERRRWLDDARFTQLLAMSQFLPGPASSQLGFAIGLQRAGWRGGLAAFIAFTLPSALLLFALATLGASIGGPFWSATVHGLKLVAVVVVADGLLKMAGQLTPDVARATIAVVAAAVVVWLGSAQAQLIALAVGAVAGLLLPSHTANAADTNPPAVERSSNATRTVVALSIFAALLAAALSVGQSAPPLLALAAAFVRAGSLVFGGGHVVLPLLEDAMVGSGWMSADTFLTGYGAAQAVPGPMFSLSAYLGALVQWSVGPSSAITSGIGAVVALLGVFAPGFLLVVAVLPSWTRLSAQRSATGVIAGVNAAVVGLLAAALYDPVLRSGITAAADVAIVAIGFALHRRLKRPALWLPAWCLLASFALAVR